jgi:hypothetical protein
MKPTIRRAAEQDAIYFAANLRPADALELQTAHPHEELVDVLNDAIRQGESFTLQFGEAAPCILFGIVKYTDIIGIIWMVATRSITGHALSILREASMWIDSWKARYGVLANYVELRNELHIRWLTILGARFTKKLQRNGVDVFLFTF